MPPVLRERDSPMYFCTTYCMHSRAAWFTLFKISLNEFFSTIPLPKLLSPGFKIQTFRIPSMRLWGRHCIMSLRVFAVYGTSSCRKTRDATVESITGKITRIPRCLFHRFSPRFRVCARTFRTDSRIRSIPSATLARCCVCRCPRARTRCNCLLLH